MMAKWRNGLSLLFYVVAVAMSVAGTLVLMVSHMKFWLAGDFALGSMSGPLVVEYVVVSIVPWVIGRLLYKRRAWDLAFYVITAIPFLMLFVMPSKFVM